MEDSQIKESLLSIPSFNHTQESLDNEDEGLKSFFSSLFLAALQLMEADVPFFIAFITRRCHILCEIYYRSLQDPQEWKSIFNTYFATKGFLDSDDLHKRLSEIYKNYFITDIALKMMGEDLVKEYLRSGNMRKLLIVDELLIHGRAVNHFLYDLESSMRQALNRFTDDSNESIIGFDDVFSRQVEVHIYICNSEKILLLPRYQKMVKKRKECKPHIWREFSIRLAHKISTSDVNNVAYSWSFRTNENSTLFSTPNETGTFQRFVTKMYKTELESFIWLYPSSDAPKAICTVRRKKLCSTQSNGLRQQLLVPYTIFPHLTWDASWHLHQVIVQDLEQAQASQTLLNCLTVYDKKIEEIPESYNIYYRRIVEMNELFINSFVMRELFGQTEALSERDRDDWIATIDFGQLSHNFAALNLNMEIVYEALYQIWTLDDAKDKLQRYMSILLENTPAISESLQRFGAGDTLLDWGASEQQKIREFAICGVEDAIAQIGYHAERNAFLNYSSKASLGIETLSEWGDHESLETVLQKCKNYLEEEYLKESNFYINLAQIGAILVHAMDYGVIGMEPIISRLPAENNFDYFQQKKCLYTELRAGEQSQFILPLRYRNLLEVLEQIAWYEDDYGNAAIELKRLARALLNNKEEYDQHLMNPYLEKKMQQFYKMMIGSGQHFKDWFFINNVNVDSRLEQLYNKEKRIRYQRAYREAK